MRVRVRVRTRVRVGVGVGVRVRVRGRYCGVLAAIGIIMIARIRRDEARKHDFRILVLWSIRATGLVLLVRLCECE